MILGNELPKQLTPERMLLLIWLPSTFGFESNITMPSALSIIVLRISQQKPTSIKKMPSARDDEIVFFIITQSEALGPPRAMLALKFFDILLPSICPKVLSVSRIPCAKLDSMLFRMIEA